MKKRNLFSEITEGFDALANARAGKHKVEINPAGGNRRRTDGAARAPEPIAPGVSALLSHQPTYARELGTGSSQT